MKSFKPIANNNSGAQDPVSKGGSPPRRNVRSSSPLRSPFAGPPRGNAINLLPATAPIYYPRNLAESAESNQALASLFSAAPAPSGPGGSIFYRPPSLSGVLHHQDLGATARSPYASPYHAHHNGKMVLDKALDEDNKRLRFFLEYADNILAESLRVNDLRNQLTPRENTSKKKKRKCARLTEEMPSNKKQRTAVPPAGDTSSKDVSSSSHNTTRKCPPSSDAVGGLARSDSAEINDLKNEVKRLSELNASKDASILQLEQERSTILGNLNDVRSCLVSIDAEIFLLQLANVRQELEVANHLNRTNHDNN